jgi:hypothetical protein
MAFPYSAPKVKALSLDGPRSTAKRVPLGTDDGSMASDGFQSIPGTPSSPSPPPPQGNLPSGGSIADHPEGVAVWVRVSPLKPQSPAAESFRSLVDQLRPQKQADGLLPTGSPGGQGPQRPPRRARLAPSPPVPTVVSEDTFVKDVGPDVEMLGISQIPSRDTGVGSSPLRADTGPDVLAASLQDDSPPPPLPPSRNRQNFWQRLNSAEVVRKLAQQPPPGPLSVPPSVPPLPMPPPLSSPSAAPAGPPRSPPLAPGGAPAPLKDASSPSPAWWWTLSPSLSSPSAAVQAGSPAFSGAAPQQSSSAAASARRSGRLPDEDVFPVQSFLQKPQSGVPGAQPDVASLSSLQAPSLPVPPPGVPIDPAEAGELHHAGFLMPLGKGGGDVSLPRWNFMEVRKSQVLLARVELGSV